MSRLLVVTCAMLASGLVPAPAFTSKSGVEPSRLSLPEGPGSIQGLNAELLDINGDGLPDVKA